MYPTNTSKFTVFGSTGFIGRNVAKYLIKQGHTVLCPGRSELPPKNLNLGHVIYTIGMAGNFRKKPFETIENEINALTHRMKNCTFESWLYLSSTRIYGTSEFLTSEIDDIRILPNADNVFNICKLLGESICMSIQDKDVKIARLSNVYGVGQSHHTFLGSLIHDFQNKKDIVIFEGQKSAKDYISILDVVALLEKISLFGRHQIYNVASGTQITHYDIALKLNSLNKVKVTFSEASQNRILAPIDTKRIQEEFDYKPRSLMKDFESLFCKS